MEHAGELCMFVLRRGSRTFVSVCPVFPYRTVEPAFYCLVIKKKKETYRRNHASLISGIQWVSEIIIATSKIFIVELETCIPVEFLFPEKWTGLQNFVCQTNVNEWKLFWDCSSAQYTVETLCLSCKGKRLNGCIMRSLYLFYPLGFNMHICWVNPSIMWFPHWALHFTTFDGCPRAISAWWVLFFVTAFQPLFCLLSVWYV